MISLQSIIEFSLLAVAICQPVTYRHASESLINAKASLTSNAAPLDSEGNLLPEMDEVIRKIELLKRELGVSAYRDNSLYASAQDVPMPLLNRAEIETFFEAERRIIEQYLEQLDSRQRMQMLQEIERGKLNDNGLFRYLRLSAAEIPFDRVDVNQVEQVRRHVDESLNMISRRTHEQADALLDQLIRELPEQIQVELSRRLGFSVAKFTTFVNVDRPRTYYTSRRAYVAGRFHPIHLPTAVEGLEARIKQADSTTKMQCRWLFDLMLTFPYSEIVSQDKNAEYLERLDRCLSEFISRHKGEPMSEKIRGLTFVDGHFRQWKTGQVNWTIRDRDRVHFPNFDPDGPVPLYHIDTVQNYADRQPPTRPRVSSSVWTTAEFFTQEQLGQIRAIESKYKKIPQLGFVDEPEAIEMLNQRNSELKDVMLPNQSASYFQEFILQVGLGDYLLAPAVALELGLTDADRERIHQLLEVGSQEIKDWELAERQEILRKALTTELPALIPQLEHRLGLQLDEMITFAPGSNYDPDSITEPKGFYRAYSYFYNDKGDYFPDHVYYHHRKDEE